MRRSPLTAAVLALFAPWAHAEGDWLVFGHVAAAASANQAPDSWSQGGVGRYLDDDARLSAHIGINWQPSLEWELMIHARADTDSDGNAQALGLVETYVARNVFLDHGSSLRVRAGQFFLPSSREAIDPLWQSRYQLSLSALNSWIAEEYRPIGVDVAWRNDPESASELEFGLTAFGGNDSSGTLLAWRGFSSHDRLSVLGEVLPLPALPTLDSGFAGQRDDGSKPFGPDLDGRIGYAARIRVGQRERFRLLASLNDNRGDRELHRGEYAWATRFWQFGAEWRWNESWTLAAEHLQGRTGMGTQTGPHVDIDYRTTYALASWQFHPEWRASARWERFAIDDRDGVQEDNSDRGHGPTLSVLYSPSEHWRFGLEWQHLNTHHAASSLIGTETETAGQVVRVEARFLF
ncbi:hypothetical protein C7S18_11060 [Ahniella affigens]|uniref:Porin n=1 Tax=Ahniella affigens TaxID=2021234 RepID=A0A2P1PSA1_9GAMM|nr:porin [Ahniella affigens]AVP97704.1 hypothetical protein C7S18_11060 [Ahniella affigens]